MQLGEAYLLADQVEDTRACADRAVMLARERGERGHEAWALRLLGDISSRHDRPDVATAEAHYGAALALASELGMRPLAARCHLGLGTLSSKIGRLEQLALGETPNLAARLQGIAAPNTLVISPATVQLLGGFFACQALGTHLMKGFAQPLAVYRVLSESMARSRLEAAGSTGLTPLVGREAEVGLLRAAMSLSRLWQRQSKRDEAHELLAPVYGWFTEGFETADLQEAKALLDTLA